MARVDDATVCDLLDSLPFATWRADASGRITAANAGFLALVGGGREAVGARVETLLEPPLATLCGRLTDDVLRSGVPAVERQATRPTPLPGSTVREVDVQPVAQGQGRSRGVVGVIRDVADAAAEQRVRDDHTAFQRLVMDLAVEFVNVPLDGVDTAIDAALRRTGSFTGVDRSYLFSYDFDADITHNTHEWCAPGVPAVIDRLQRVPLSLISEWVQTHRRGDVMHIPSVSARPAQDPLRVILEDQGVETVLAVPLLDGPRCLGFVGFDVVGGCKRWTRDELGLLRVLAELFTNSQVRREHERVLVEARHRAERASSAKSRFLSVISHELRTPMHGVLGMADLLVSGQLTDEQRDYAGVIENSARSLLSLLDDLLDTARIESGRVELRKAPMRLRRLFDELRALMAADAADKSLSLVFEVAVEVPDLVIADELRLRQVISNLVDNAVKFTDAGAVDVSLRLDGPLVAGDVPLRLEVRDTGIGMDPDDLPELFVPFVQAEDTATRRFGGIGLGLSVVHELTRLMGGTLAIDTQPGVGTRVVLEIVVGLASEPVEPTENEEVGPGSRVLVVEDNEVNQAVARAYLEDLGCEVTVASDGFAGVEAAAGAEFDLVLMDCFMPMLDGFEASRRIRRDGASRGTPIVALTANAAEENVRICREAGMHDVLTKPYGRDDLSRILRRWSSIVA